MASGWARRQQGRGGRARLNTQLWSQQLQLALSTQHANSGHGPDLRTWSTFHSYWWEEAGFPPTPSPPVLLSVLYPASVSLEGSPGCVPQPHPEIWSGAHPNLRPATFGTIPALISYPSDLKRGHFTPAAHHQDTEDCGSGQGQAAKRRGLVMRMACSHPLQWNKASGICTPLGTWPRLPLV